MKAKRKQLSICIEYTDPHEAEIVLNRVVSAIKARSISSDRVITDEITYEWSIVYLETSDFREEFINGKWCIVIPSKLNKL
jgi:hypothetical protein